MNRVFLFSLIVIFGSIDALATLTVRPPFRNGVYEGELANCDEEFRRRNNYAECFEWSQADVEWKKTILSCDLNDCEKVLSTEP